MGTIQLRIQQQAIYNLNGLPTNTNAFVLRPVRYSTIDHETFLNYCATNSTVPRAALRASLEAFISGIEDLLLNGHSIKLEGLGTFSLSATTRARSDVNQAGMNQLCKLHIRFRPATRLKRMIKQLSFNLDGVYEIAGVNNDGAKYYRKVDRKERSSDTQSDTSQGVSVHGNTTTAASPTTTVATSTPDTLPTATTLTSATITTLATSTTGAMPATPGTANSGNHHQSSYSDASSDTSSTTAAASTPTSLVVTALDNGNASILPT